MKNAHILLVEDNEGDIMLTQEVFSNAGLCNPLSVTRDGEQALDFLYKRNSYAAAERPDLILLDINLPRINGKEVLAAVKNDEALKTIPIIMLTTSDAEIDIMESYQHHANCFVTKPLSFEGFTEAVLQIKKFWFTLVTTINNKNTQQ